MSQPPQQPPDPYPPPPGPEGQPGPGQGPYGPPPQGPPMQGPPPHGPPPHGPPPQGPPMQGPPPQGPPPPGAGPQPYGGPAYGQQPYGPAPGYEAYGAPGYGTLAGAPPLADAGKRFLARLIDYALVVAVSLIVNIPVYVNMINNMQESFEQSLTTGQPATPSPFSSIGLQLVMSLVVVVLFFVYDWLMHAYAGGQTLGKKALKIRVVRLDGTPASAGSLAARSAVFTLPPIIYCIGTIFWLVNVLSLLWDKPYQQCFHDKAAKTIVVHSG